MLMLKGTFICGTEYVGILNCSAGLTNYIRREQFNALLEILSEGSPFNVKAWEYQYEQYHGKREID